MSVTSLELTARAGVAARRRGRCRRAACHLSTTAWFTPTRGCLLPSDRRSFRVRPRRSGSQPAPKVWAYQIGGAANYPANSIVAQRGTTTTVSYTNALPVNPDLQKVLTVDQTLHWADPFGNMGATTPYQGTPPLVVHLHGAEVPSAFDGVPEAWFTPDGKHGRAFSTSVYQYPNTQPATTLWFHDHALGMTRLNVYSGLAGACLLRDRFDTGLANNPLGLPAGAQEIELILQDRQFDTTGQLYFPDGSETDPTSVLNGDPPNPGIHPFWIPEYFGDAIVVNGRTWPYLEVEPRRYRFRVVNGSNARFFRMTLASSSGLSDDQADIVSYAQRVVAETRVDQALFDRLSHRHGPRWLVELTVTAGHFGLISGINNAFDVPPSAGGDELPI